MKKKAFRCVTRSFNMQNEANMQSVSNYENITIQSFIYFVLLKIHNIKIITATLIAYYACIIYN